MKTKNKKEENIMKYKIGVMGKAGRGRCLPELLIKSAEIIGRKIAKENCILITGACMGVPDIAARSAIAAGGLVLGYSPAKDLKGHLEPPISYPRLSKGMIPIYTGYGKIGRNVLSIFECDGLIFIGGGIGTLNEFSIAYHEGKVIGVLEGVEGIAQKVLQIEGDFKDTGAAIVKDKSPERLVEKVIEEIEKREEGPRKEIPITFKNEKGKNLAGILHLPEQEKPPLVIICHGFQGTKTDRKYVKLARRLTEEGILVLRFDFEGCGDSEGDPKELTVEREVSDLNSALRAVLKECDINSKRIAFIGGSLGGTIVTYLVEKFKIPAKALVLLAPAFNQKELFENWYTKKEIKEIKDKGFLTKGEKEIGKNYYLENKDKDYSFTLSRFSLPILIIHGEKDEDVPLEFSEKLSQKYKNITLKILSKANHKFNDFGSQEKLIKETVKWLKKYL